VYYDIALDLPIGRTGWDRFKHILFNMGGPRSRTRKETVRSSILENPAVSISWPRKMLVGLTFPAGADPVELLNAILEKRGLADPDDAKAICELPSGIHFCSTFREPGKDDKALFPDVLTAEADAVLKTAIILCLCNRHFYDPGHSAIWTANRLKRKVCLYRVGDFYAAD
jgi:hypothetical protein